MYLLVASDMETEAPRSCIGFGEPLSSATTKQNIRCFRRLLGNLGAVLECVPLVNLQIVVFAGTLEIFVTGGDEGRTTMKNLVGSDIRTLELIVAIDSLQ
jgi:hypothetical protein